MKTFKHEIKKGIPVPSRANGQKPKKYPFSDLEVGDCLEFTVPKDVSAVIVQSRISTNARNFGDPCGRKFTTRQLKHKGKIGCWRVE